MFTPSSITLASVGDPARVHKRSDGLRLVHGGAGARRLYSTSPRPQKEASHVTAFAKKLAQLKNDLVTQGERVMEMTLR
ncbi:MAG: hypothetical protein O6933_03020, partial [Planctomycetota bacterium]|nr:hypothetical protein [Planctomycetota bacterium]